MRRSLIVVSVLCILWFLQPALRYGIINIGNLTGMLFFAAVLLCALFPAKFCRILAVIWRNAAGRAVLSVAAVLGVCGIILILVITALMAGEAARAPEGECTVVVLGCQVRGTRPSLMLQERLDAACRFLSENDSLVCVVSGGKGEDENIPEAECMYNYLVEKGIAAERLYREDRSTSTRENLAFSRELIEREGLPPKLAIVTNEFHEYRAGKVADSLGLAHGAVPAATAWWLLPTYYVRELYGVLYQWLL